MSELANVDQAEPAGDRVRCRHGQVWKRNPVTRPDPGSEWLGDPYQAGLRLSTVALLRDHGPLEPLT